MKIVTVVAVDVVLAVVVLVVVVGATNAAHQSSCNLQYKSFSLIFLYILNS